MTSPVPFIFVLIQIVIIGQWYANCFPDASVFEVFFPTLLWIGLGIRSALVHLANSINSLFVIILSAVQELANNKRDQNGV